MSRRCIIRIPAAAILLAAAQSVSGQDLFAEGSAYDPQSGELLYTEKHYQLDEQRRRVDYFEADGRPFASKLLDYSADPAAPGFRQRNERSGEHIDVFYTNDNLQVVYRKSRDATDRRYVVALQQSLVIDAGFDSLVKQHWSQLSAGEDLKIRYLLPTRGSTLQLKVRKTSACADARLCLEISPTNPVFKLFSADIQLEYQQASRTLLRFSGRGNIADHRGRYRNVSISYRHFPLQ